MKEKLATALVLQLAALMAQASTERGELSGDLAGEGLREVALGTVPENVIAAARGAAPSVYLTGAERFLAADIVVYRLQGRLFREVWDIYVRENGTLLSAGGDNQDD